MKETDKVAIMLSQGFTKKEIASKLNKSVHTINEQTRKLYERTGSRNLADITRWVISRYTGTEIDRILVNALHDLFIAAATIFIFYMAVHPELAQKAMDTAASMINLLKK